MAVCSSGWDGRQQGWAPAGGVSSDISEATKNEDKVNIFGRSALRAPRAEEARAEEARAEEAEAEEAEAGSSGVGGG